ncbi:MlaC/ttg2D family ABC transporter substrate-binding protein [Acidihalobacter ferrooxydans]|nr:ABC transporter substrate-binding protein [Acidihalobacter ferrooxydans]
MKKWIGIWLAVLLLPFMAPAWAAQNLTPVQQAQATVEHAANQALKALHAEPKADLSKPAVIDALIAHYVLPVVDIEASARLVLGHYWRTATPAQRKAFVEQFKHLLIRTYGKSLSTYPGAKIRYLSNRDTSDGRFATVHTEVVPNGHAPVSVDYGLFKVGGKWKIYDLTISGLSLVQSYRSTFSEEIQQTSLQALIKRLTKQNQAAGKG